MPYHWARDVLGLKRTLHRIEQLVAIAPGLATHREVIRAMYEGHRGRPDLALTIYASIDEQLAPFTNPIWSAARSHQAECLNMLGRPAEALEVCEEARSHLTSADRATCLPTSSSSVNRRWHSPGSAASRGRLGSSRLARGMRALRNPLVRGLLHHDRARVACAARDREAFAAHWKRPRESLRRPQTRH